MEPRPKTKLTWGQAIAWFLAQWLIAFAVGHGVALCAGYEHFGEELVRDMYASVACSYFLLRCGLLHLLFGWTDSTMATMPVCRDAFSLIYVGAVLSLQVLFLWSRRWWPLFVALCLLLLGAGGCAGFVSTISIKM